MHRQKIPKAVRFAVLERDGYACRYCGARAPDAQLEIDHVVAVTLGGTNHPANLRTACQACNAGKAARLLPDDDLGQLAERVATMIGAPMERAYAMAYHVIGAEVERRGELDDDERAALACVLFRFFLHHGPWDYGNRSPEDAASFAASVVRSFVDEHAVANDLPVDWFLLWHMRTDDVPQLVAGLA